MNYCRYQTNDSYLLYLIFLFLPQILLSSRKWIIDCQRLPMEEIIFYILPLGSRVIGIFKNSKYILSMSLGCFRNKAVTFYAKTGSRYLKSTIRILKKDFVKSTLWSLFLPGKSLWFVPHIAVSEKEKREIAT